ncbi:MAG: hypothetical protein AAF616_14695 [Bacteroidota bacterium]
MKYLTILATIAILFFRCEGPVGPQGRDGLQGAPGEEAFVFEYEFDFTAPEYSVLLSLPDDFTMLDSDVMLAYLLWEVTEDGTEVWRALPESLYFTDGILEYNYDFTKFDASVYLDGTVNFDGLGSDLTDQWIARLVVVPGQFNDRSTLNLRDYEQVKSFYNLSPSRLATSRYPKRPEK